jgi:putative ABC transport system permease protein
MLNIKFAPWLDGLFQDLRHSLRGAKNRPRFVLAAVLTFGLGIGATSTIFSVARAMLLHTVELPQFERLAYIYSTWLPKYTRNLLSPEEARWLRRECRSFETIALTSSVTVLVSGAGDPFNADGLRVSGEFFDVLGAAPKLGRFIRSEDDVSGAQSVVVLSHHLWRVRFGGDPAVVGRHLELNGKAHLIIGIAGRDVSTLDDRSFPKEFWIPAAQAETRIPFIPVGRLRPGFTIQAANAELSALGARMASEFPDCAGCSFTALPVADVLLGDTRSRLRALVLAVGTLLLIACVNISCLLMTRIIGRRAEVSLRWILGASRFRLCRLILFETLWLSVAGGIAGVALSFASLRGIVALGSATLPGLESVRLDRTALLFALAIAAFAALLSSAAPAFFALRTAAARSLSSAPRGGAHTGVRRVGSVFVALQFAAGLILLTGSGILLANFIGMLRLPLAFAPDSLVIMELFIPYGGLPRNAILPDEILRRLRRLHGIEDVALAEPGVTLAGLHVELRPPGAAANRSLAPMTFVSPGFFRVMHVPLLEGREFTAADAASSAPPIIINEAVARQLWPNQTAVGQQLVMPAETRPRRYYASQVVGVVRTASIYGVHYSRSTLRQIYRPLSRDPGTMQFLVRTAEPPARIAPMLRRVVRDVEPRQPVDSIATLHERVAGQVVPDRFYTCLLLTFSLIAIAIAAAGLHGLLSYVVAAATHEIGVRIAMGARTADLVALLSGYGLRSALGGIAIGLLGSYAATGLLESLLYHVKARDPLTFAAAALTFTVISFVACISPLRAMLRVDPADHLRSE